LAYRREDPELDSAGLPLSETVAAPNRDAADARLADPAAESQKRSSGE
jgi:hypothetical protein